MAKKTGHIESSASEFGRRCRFVDLRWATWLSAVVFCCVLPTTIHAENPRLRSPSGRAGGDSEDDTKRSGGLFGIRSLIGSDKNEQIADADDLIDALPVERLTPQARQRIASITDKPTIRRRLPAQAIRCDEDLFLFLTRQPEAIIGLWDLMGITNVQAERIGPYQLRADDSSGTTCVIDLIYGDRNLHVYYAEGMYDGKFTQKPIVGKGLFVFRSSYAIAADGETTVMGTLDCYVKFESLGADLIARSLSGLIGKSADHNFVETASFISQVSGACQSNPKGMLDMVEQLPQVNDSVRAQFETVVKETYRRSVIRQASRATSSRATTGTGNESRQQGVQPTRR
ncbi:hypothetical protein U8335_10360 [Roseiconus lacunae]|uniref:hypothetical protein n=1 Tax=Roseiconus lacunae TaxID=2605694 RepID=UPI00308FE3EA|nr:hypothetical protein U8335_10360 [Stieleria sp. HD01]